METCGNPVCDQPGTNKCSACKTTFYCGKICQTADWSIHKEMCPGHLRKVGMTNLEKAKGFHEQQNWPQTLFHSDLAATKLKQLKDRRPVEDIDVALNFKFDSLNWLGRNKEALECAKEWYCLWPTKHTHPPAIRASFCLIESCMHNKEYADAALYAGTRWEIINDKSSNNHIPENERDAFTARGALEYARSTLHLAKSGGIPSEDKQRAGQEAIMLTRRAIAINTQLHGIESAEVAIDLGVLAQVIGGFNDVDDDEILRLLQQSIDITTLVNGRLSSNVAAGEGNLANAYVRRANKAHEGNDMDLHVANLELSLPHYHEAIRIYRAVNRLADVDRVTQDAANVEKTLHVVTTMRSAVAAAMRG